MKIRDLMNESVSTVRVSQTASAALRAMWDCDCGSIPVLDDDGRAIAMVTDRDIAMATLFRDTPPSALPVSDVMSRSLQSCSPDDDLSRAEELLRTHQIRRLPVVDDDRRVVGILSLADVVRSAAKRSDKGGKKTTDAVTATMAVICSPRLESPAPL